MKLLNKIILILLLLFGSLILKSQNITIKDNYGFLNVDPSNLIINKNKKIYNFIKNKSNTYIIKLTDNKIKIRTIEKFEWLDSKSKIITSYVEYTTNIIIYDDYISINYNIIKINVPFVKILSFFGRKNTLIKEIENVFNKDFNKINN